MHQWELKENVASPDSTPEVRALWNVYENENGESSLKTHTLKTVWQSCPKDECFYELTDSPKREVTCTKCGSITTFIVGPQALVDGKIVSLRQVM